MSHPSEYQANEYDKKFTNKLRGERVLLVGGGGFIGHHLALDLRSIGVDTMVFDNLI